MGMIDDRRGAPILRTFEEEKKGKKGKEKIKRKE